MDKDQKQALQTAKEIVVKFIEVGRVSPTNIDEIFPQIYDVVLSCLRRDAAADDEASPRAGHG